MIWSDPTTAQSGLLEEILRSLRQPGSDKGDIGSWKWAELLRRANFVMRKICEESECLRLTDISNVSIIGTSQYNKPAACSRLIKVGYAGKRIFGIMEAELDMARPNWATDNNDTPRRYIDNPSNIVLYPTPSAAGDTISMQFITQPTELVNPTDIPFNALNSLYSFHDLIAAGVVYRCLLEEKSPYMSEWKGNYNDGMKKLKEFVRKMPDTMMTETIAGPENFAHDTFAVPRPWMY
jgi:hypothetical protein